MLLLQLAANRRCLQAALAVLLLWECQQYWLARRPAAPGGPPCGVADGSKATLFYGGRAPTLVPTTQVNIPCFSLLSLSLSL